MQVASTVPQAAAGFGRLCSRPLGNCCPYLTHQISITARWQTRVRDQSKDKLLNGQQHLTSQFRQMKDTQSLLRWLSKKLPTQIPT